MVSRKALTVDIEPRCYITDYIIQMGFPVVISECGKVITSLLKHFYKSMITYAISSPLDIINGIQSRI